MTAKRKENGNYAKNRTKSANRTTLNESQLQEGDNLDLLALQKDEYVQRKPVAPIIVAQGFQRAISDGASKEQVAEANGVSLQTVERWLSFLELKPKEQDKLNLGKLKHEDAIAIVEDRRKGGTGKTDDGLSAEEAAEVQPANSGKGGTDQWSTKKIEDTYANPPTDWPGIKPEQIRRVLGVILGKLDEGGTDI